MCGGISKWCGAGGWRLGVSLFPRSLQNSLKPVVVGILSETISCVASPVQYAAVKAYTLCPEIDTYLHHQRRILRLQDACFMRGSQLLVCKCICLLLGSTATWTLVPSPGSSLKKEVSRHRMTFAATSCPRVYSCASWHCFWCACRASDCAPSICGFQWSQSSSASYGVPLDDSLDEAFLVENCPKLVEGCKKIAEYCVSISNEE